MPDELALPSIRVAVKANTNHDWAQDALINMEEQCDDTKQFVHTKMGEFKIFDCEPAALNNKK